MYKKINNQKINNFIIKNFKWKGNKETLNIKKECLIMCLIKLSKKNNLEEQIEDGINLFNEFINENIEKEYQKWLDIMDLKIKKLPYLINLHKTLNMIKIDDFSSTFWADASSNAIQLIVFRLGSLNEKLLMLTNIIDNKTEYKNIYDYVFKKIIEKNNNNLISLENLKKIENYDSVKYRIMPACYGMGKTMHKKKLKETIKKDPTIAFWKNLTDIEKNKIADYLWNLTWDILAEIGFNYNEYKNVCKELSKEDWEAFMWETDIGTHVLRLRFRKSKRPDYRKEIERIKLKIKNKQNIDKNNEKIQILKKKLIIDDKLFWRRTKICINGKYIFYPRIYHPFKIIDVRKIKQAIIANSIHSYDGSIAGKTVIECKKIGINVLTIHDSLGSELINAPYVKIMFKIVNIYFLNKNINNPIFPFKKFNINKNDFEKIIIKIIESDNFFR